MNKRLLTIMLSSSLLSFHTFAADDGTESADSSEPQPPSEQVPVAIETSTNESSAEEPISTEVQLISEAENTEVIEPISEPIAEPEPTPAPEAAPNPAPAKTIQAAAEEATQLQQLIALNAENKFTLAYQLANNMRSEWEGDEKFDFNFALAAAQTAHYNEAVFPFERLLDSHPNNLRFRLELARCHFFLNNLSAAEREFNTVAAHNPPAEVQGHIKRFLTRIAEKKQQVTQSWNARAGLALGYDSNINAAADLDAIDATFYLNDSPALTGVLTLEDEQKSQASSYYQLQGYGQYQQPLSKRSSVDFSVSGSMKDNSIDDSYDLTNIALSGGFRMLRSNHNLRFGGVVRQYWLAGESLQNQLLGNVAWQWHFAPYWKTTVEFELGNQDNDQNDALDFTQWEGKAALNRNIDGFAQNVQVGIGSDMASDSANDFQGRNYYALSYQAQQSLAGNQQMYALINYRTNNYADAFADDHIFFAGETREDQLIQLIAGWVYEFMPDISTKIQLSHSQNESNLELYDYQRTLIEAGLAISFK